MSTKFIITTSDGQLITKYGEQQPSDGGLVIRLRDGGVFVIPQHNLAYYEARDMPSVV